MTKQAQQDFPDAGWEIRSRSKASPQLERSVDRFTQFLTLVGLTTLLVGGVGVANAVASHLARKRDVIGTMKALGATSGDVFAVYCTETLLVALFATLIGALLGALLPFAIVWGFGGIIPLPVAPSLHPTVLALAIVYGLLTALAFALWPLGRAHDISVTMLFRDQIAAERNWPRRRYVIATAAIAALLAALAVVTSYDRRVAVYFVIAAALVFLLLRLIAQGDHGAGAPRAAFALDRAAARHRQYPPPRRADAERGAVARPGPRPPRHRDRDRRQSAPRIRRRASRTRALVLLHRRAGGRCRALRHVRA